MYKYTYIHNVYGKIYKQVVYIKCLEQNSQSESFMYIYYY